MWLCVLCGCVMWTVDWWWSGVLVSAKLINVGPG